MPNDIARDFARCERGLVVGPAGCGKTHLIAKAVGLAEGKQLVLTHTHAGVHALRTKICENDITSAQYRVTTIDSLALCFVRAFPHLAGWASDYPSDDEEWTALRVAACRLFRCRAPRRVLRASYAGIFVDEYQDCCGTQHAMIEAIAEIFPCRIVGDPLQAIYSELHERDIVKWSEVKRTFSVIGELTVPYRWLKTNPELGEWLADVRFRLMKGCEVDFTNSCGAVNWIQFTDERVKISSCQKTYNKEGVIAICKWHNQCVDIAAKTKNHFSALESVECSDLLKAAESIENSTGINRLECIVDFARKCLTGMTALTNLFDRMKKGAAYSPHSPDKVRLWSAMQAVAKSTELREVTDLMSAIDNISDSHYFKRRELWQEMSRTLQYYDPGSGITLREAAWRRRDYVRRNGRRVLSHRVIATPLLIKGLEFHHALLLDASQMKSAEELYVALTRGALSLTVLSSTPRVERTIPAYLQEI